MLDKYKLNLQLFNESEKTEGVAEPLDDRDIWIGAEDAQTKTKTEDVQVDSKDIKTDVEVDVDTEKQTDTKVETEKDNKDMSFKDDPSNKKFAAMRREKEALEKELNELKNTANTNSEVDNWYAEKFGDMGVKSESDYRAKLNEQFTKEQEAKLIEKAKEGDVEANKQLIIRGEEFKKAVNEALENHPLILRQKENLIKQMEQQEVKAFNDEFGEKFTSIKDVANLPNAEQLKNYMSIKKPDGKYVTLSEAHKIVNHDYIVEKAEKAAKQKAINKITGKDHVKDTKANSDTIETPIPNDIIQQYREFYPDMSMEEIKTAYRKAEKEGF